MLLEGLILLFTLDHAECSYLVVLCTKLRADYYSLKGWYTASLEHQWFVILSSFCLSVMLKFTYFTHSLSHHRIHATTHLHKWSSTKISAINSLCVCQLNDGATRVGDGIHRVVHLELSSLNACTASGFLSGVNI